MCPSSTAVWRRRRRRARSHRALASRLGFPRYRLSRDRRSIGTARRSTVEARTRRDDPARRDRASTRRRNGRVAVGFQGVPGRGLNPPTRARRPPQRARDVDASTARERRRGSARAFDVARGVVDVERAAPRRRRATARGRRRWARGKARRAATARFVRVVIRDLGRGASSRRSLLARRSAASMFVAARRERDEGDGDRGPTVGGRVHVQGARQTVARARVCGSRVRCLRATDDEGRVEKICTEKRGVSGGLVRARCT